MFSIGKFKKAAISWAVKATLDDSAESGINKIIGMFILIILGANLIPAALTAINGANTTGWNATDIAIWGVVSLVVIIAFVLMLFKSSGTGDV